MNVPGNINGIYKVVVSHEGSNVDDLRKSVVFRVREGGECLKNLKGKKNPMFYAFNKTMPIRNISSKSNSFTLTKEFGTYFSETELNKIIKK